MAGNNLLHFLRGGLGKATDTSKLEPGQPFYNYTKNYLTIGGKDGTSVNGKPLTVRELVGYAGDSGSITGNANPDKEFHLKYDDETNTLELLTPDKFVLKSDTVDIAKYSSDNSGTITLYKPISSSYSATYSSLTINGNTNCDTLTINGDTKCKNIIPLDNDTYNLGSDQNKFNTLCVKEVNVKEVKNSNGVTIKVENNKVLASSIELSSSNILIKAVGSGGSSIKLSINDRSQPIITMNGIIEAGDIGQNGSPIGTVYATSVNANAISSPTIDTINTRLDELGFKQGNIKDSANTIGYVAQLGTIVYGCIWEGLLLNGEQSFTIDSLISPCPKSTSVGAIPCYPIASSTGNVVRVPCSINGNTITTNTGYSSYKSKSNADFYFWYDTNTDHKYPNKTS